MIDYEKLKIAHDIMLKHNKYYCTFEFGWSDKVQFVLYSDEDEAPIFTCCKIDDLIAQLQELTKPQPKYKIGNDVWFLMDNVARCSSIFEDLYYEKSWSYTLNDDGLRWRKESLLYPTKQSLVEAQIEYWQKMKADIQINQHKVDVDRCQHEDDGIFYNMAKGPECMKWDYKCKKCGEFYR